MLLERSLPSLAKQTFKTFKVTIVDDGSTRGEFQQIKTIAEEYRQSGLQIDVVQNQGSTGASGARNFGLDVTSSEYILWFDSDDILLEKKLELSMSLITSGNYDLAITRAQHVVNANLVKEFWGEPIAPNRNSYEFHFPYQTMCALYRRSFLNRSKIRWHEKIEMTNDWVFSNEVLLMTNNWIYSPAVTAHYYVPTMMSGSIGSQLTKTKIQSQKKSFQIIKRVLDEKKMSYSKMSRIKLLFHQMFLFLISIKTA